MRELHQISIDLQKGVVFAQTNNGVTEHPLDSAEAFSLVSQAWVRCGWDAKYVYSFSWLGRPVIQLPDDMMRIQELIFQLQPDVIIETGVAHGGSLIFYATLCKAMEKGRVIGIDIEIRPPNRKAIEAHFIFPYITLIEGSSIAPEVVSEVRKQVKPGEKTLILLDSCHTKEHVLAELEAYSPLVSKDSYIVATDGIMGWLGNAPRTKPDWNWNNPAAAAGEFLKTHPEFALEEPKWTFNEGKTNERVTYWPDAFLKRIS